MGPTAIAPYIDGGGSSHVTPYDPAQSPYDALTAKAPNGAKLSYVPGYDLDGQLAAYVDAVRANYPRINATTLDTS